MIFLQSSLCSWAWIIRLQIIRFHRFRAREPASLLHLFKKLTRAYPVPMEPMPRGRGGGTTPSDWVRRMPSHPSWGFTRLGIFLDNSFIFNFNSSLCSFLANPCYLMLFSGPMDAMGSSRTVMKQHENHWTLPSVSSRIVMIQVLYGASRKITGCQNFGATHRFLFFIFYFTGIRK